MKKFKFEGQPTMMNRTVIVYGNTYEEMYNELIEKNEMHFDTLDSYLQEKHNTNFMMVDEDGEEWYDQDAFDQAFIELTDDEYYDIMTLDNGNMYYQTYYTLVDGEYVKQ